MKLDLTILLSAVAIAIGIGTAGYFVSTTVYRSQIAMNTAQAKGLAERKVKANLATWRVSFSVSGKTQEEIPALYKTAESQQQRLVDELKASGLEDSEITPGLIGYSMQEYRDENQNLVEERHSLTGSVEVKTEEVEKIAISRTKVNRLIAEGLDLTNSSPRYIYTKLNDIKPAMLREAAQNARIAAVEFAENAGVEVGKIRSATQGAFFIQDEGENSGDTRKVNKNVRVVTTVEFFLTD
jgi:hypothetical protein